MDYTDDIIIEYDSDCSMELQGVSGDKEETPQDETDIDV